MPSAVPRAVPGTVGVVRGVGSMTRRPASRMLPPPSTVATAPNPALIPLTSHAIAGRYGAESPLDPAGGLAGKTAQNRQTPPPISAPQKVKHDREQRHIQACRHGVSPDR